MRIAILFSYCIKQKYSKLPIIRFKYEEKEAHKRLQITVALNLTHTQKKLGIRTLLRHG